MIIGHERILEFLKRSIKNKRLAHAYLFVGPAHLGKRTVALEFIRMLVGKEIDKAVHPDILIVEPEVVEKDGIKKELEIGIKEARKIQHQMSLFPYQTDYKIALIDEAERMTSEASNCLLKTLEEPSGKAILILVTANPQRLLPTIVSRCQLINFLPVAEKEIKDGIKILRSPTSKDSEVKLPKISDDELRRIIRLANRRPGLVINYLENPELLEEQSKIIEQLGKLLRADLNDRYKYVEEIAKNVPVARQILNYWLFWFRDLLLLAVGCPDLVLYPEASQYQEAYSLPKLKSIIRAIKKTDWLLTNPSINARLALEVLMLEL
jgi:DNA polymerase-3 subunit delta'